MEGRDWLGPEMVVLLPLIGVLAEEVRAAVVVEAVAAAVGDVVDIPAGRRALTSRRINLTRSWTATIPKRCRRNNLTSKFLISIPVF